MYGGITRRQHCFRLRHRRMLFGGEIRFEIRLDNALTALQTYSLKQPAQTVGCALVEVELFR